MTTDKKPRRDLYQEVTDKIIEALEKSNGETRWKRPWSILAEHGLPHNGITGRHYSGINVLLLAMEAEQRGFDDPRYFTFKQASQAGFTVRKGAKTMPLYFYKKLETDQPDRETGEIKKQIIPFLTEYRVFNAIDIIGLEPIHNPPPQWQPHDVMEKLVKKLGVNVQYGGTRAFYDIGNDMIRLPVRGAFPSKDSWAATLCHEISHWTGHPSRKNRAFGPYGTELYAKEELRAEISSAMLSSYTGIAADIENSAAYVESWIKVLKSDRREIFRAASDATKIVDFMLGRNQDEAGTVSETSDAATVQLASQPGVRQSESPTRRPMRNAERDFSKARQTQSPSGIEAGVSGP